MSLPSANQRVVVYSLWLVSSAIFVSIFSGIRKGRELMINANLRTGNIEQAEKLIWNFTISDLLPLVLVLMSLLLVLITRRKGLLELTHVLSHMHWLILIVFLLGSQLFN